MLKRSLGLVLLGLLGLAGCNNNGINSGDRVLVAKCLYETRIKAPARFDVVVFKYPAGPMKSNVPTNYIKRLMGLPGEMLAIFFGQIFRMTPPVDEIPGLPKVENPLDLWRDRNQPSGPEFQNKINEWFDNRKFEIVRKPPEVMMAMRRIVNDNNYQAADLKNFPARWQPRAGSGWTMAENRKTFSFKPGDSKDIDWLTYQHRIRPEGVLNGASVLKPQLITDAMGYNDFNLHDAGRRASLSVNWVGDLMLEATVNVTQPTGEFFMELNKGSNRFQARWDLASGQCTLIRIDREGMKQELGSAPTPLRGVGKHTVRFANFDARLTVWVNRDLPFGDGIAYDPPEFSPAERGPTRNDLDRPASLGALGASLEVSDLRLWRDTYYTMNVSHADVSLTPEVLANPDEWEPFRKLTPAASYIYPDHYLCLGDNSTHSSDSRQWGLVPDRLLLGRALMVYYPLNRAGLIR
jgi:signal peptidase I